MKRWFQRTKSVEDIVQPIGNFCSSTEWILEQHWKVVTKYGTLSILAGYKSDGASVPRLFHTALGPRFEPMTFAAALAHDACYSSHYPLVDNWREQADDLFLDLLRRLGVSWVKRKLYWVAVRLFGWLVVNTQTLDSVAESRRFCGWEDTHEP